MYCEHISPITCSYLLLIPAGIILFATLVLGFNTLCKIVASVCALDCHGNIILPAPFSRLYCLSFPPSAMFPGPWMSDGDDMFRAEYSVVLRFVAGHESLL